MQQRIDSLAQQVEHNTFNVGVLGSSPRRITQKKAIILKKVIAFFIFVQMGGSGFSRLVSFLLSV